MQKNDFAQLIAGLTDGFTPVIEAGFPVSGYTHVDLSIHNPELTGEQLASDAAFSDFLSAYLKTRRKDLAWGGYNEKRGLYRRSELFSAKVEEEEIRNIHLGIDIWVDAGTPVLAALSGRVHSFANNAGFGDYGPTIILEHQFQGQNFFTLYGHLSLESLNDIREGQGVDKGQQIATLGTPSENGNYAPHLHFQIMRELQGRRGDFPGVTSIKELEEYLEVCPDPNLLLKIPE